MPQIIHFKETPDLGQFLSTYLNSSVIALAYLMAATAWARWGKELTITEIYREIDPNGTHKAWRAVDVRNSNFLKAEALELAKVVNDYAIYDPARPELNCCIVYELDPKGHHDDHFHLQVHERTVFVNAE